LRVGSVPGNKLQRILLPSARCSSQHRRIQKDTHTTVRHPDSAHVRERWWSPRQRPGGGSVTPVSRRRFRLQLSDGGSVDQLRSARNEIKSQPRYSYRHITWWLTNGPITSVPVLLPHICGSDGRHSKNRFTNVVGLTGLEVLSQIATDVRSIFHFSLHSRRDITPAQGIVPRAAPSGPTDGHLSHHPRRHLQQSRDMESSPVRVS